MEHGDARAKQRRRRERRAAARRRRAAALALSATAIVAFAVGIAIGAAGGDGGAVDASADSPAELPRGGRSLLPEHRLVAFYGAPQDEQLGALGIGSPEDAVSRLHEQARRYRRGDRPVLPALELIATIAAADAGEDGNHRFRQPHQTIRRYLSAARDGRALLVLDVQPGRADFIDETRRLRRYLREPDVGLALDPEWHVGPDEVPGEVIGSVDAATVNRVSAYLQRIVERHDLPEKLLVVHQFTRSMISRRDQLVDRAGVAVVINADGFGERREKIAKYRLLRPRRESPLHAGFKLFYEEDSGLMSPADVLDLEPVPDLIVYE